MNGPPKRKAPGKGRSSKRTDQRTESPIKLKSQPKSVLVETPLMRYWRRQRRALKARAK